MTVLGFHEIVVRVEPSAYFLAETTAPRPDAEVLCLPNRWSPTAKAPGHLIHVLGPDEDRRAILAAFDEADVPTRRVGDGLRFDTLAVEDRDAALAVVAPFAAVLDALGPDAQLDPFLVREGAIVGHLVVPDPGGDGDVLRSLRKGAETAAWEDWKLVRISGYNPGRLARYLRDEKLSTKQLEVTKMGLALGFYDSPRGCTLDTLADLFGISKAAVHNRLKAAERKIIAEYFA